MHNLPLSKHKASPITKTRKMKKLTNMTYNLNLGRWEGEGIGQWNTCLAKFLREVLSSSASTTHIEINKCNLL